MPNTGGLTQVEMDEMVLWLTEWFPDTADIYRLTRTPDEWGSETDVYTKVATSPVFWGAQSTGLTDVELAQEIVASNSFTFPGNVDIQQTDRIVSRGRTFDVESISLSGAWSVATWVTVREVVD